MGASEGEAKRGSKCSQSPKTRPKRSIFRRGAPGAPGLRTGEPRQCPRRRMEWQVLVLAFCLGLAHSAAADCAAQCATCALQSQDLEQRINPLICSLECQGALPSRVEWERCYHAPAAEGPGLSPLEAEAPAEPEGSPLPGGLAKRYGGFMKKLDKNRLGSLLRESALGKGGAAKKDAGFPRLPGERAAAEDYPALETGEEPEDGEPRDARKRYGGFLRKYPKRRSERAPGAEGPELEDLHKRYGALLRRIRPKLKWDNQKRYGGFLRRQFKVTTRSEEDPAAYSGEVSDL
nr:proenkephalin-B isoform X1 [Pelodiscus sinensis]|eukprot:XP_014433733.1 proenkephalin-B isoform X1 [Pelodiscus sinensis]